MHQEPEEIHKLEVLANHFFELVTPILVLFPNRRFRMLGGFLQIIFQVCHLHFSIAFFSLVLEIQTYLQIFFADSHYNQWKF